ncbi:hypothetical protein [Streptomyces sp. Wb2n-11]|uniref:hypothetical protein n=1 Tax=Streptomyces sp. Wb2n-11 TaxID=1030533 RepID=UPI0011469031|nr:hypothetical protein [Streptomyces sp. Wb2n-11]
MTIDLGSFPAWFGAATFGTAGVGYLTYRRSRLKEDREAAEAVGCRDGRRNCCGYGMVASSWTANVDNRSARPIYHVYLLTSDSKTGTVNKPALLYKVLAPGVADHEHMEAVAPEGSRPTAVLFCDDEGTWWMRSLLDQRLSMLLRAGRVRRTLRRLSPLTDRSGSAVVAKRELDLVCGLANRRLPSPEGRRLGRSD